MTTEVMISLQRAFDCDATRRFGAATRFKNSREASVPTMIASSSGAFSVIYQLTNLPTYQLTNLPTYQLTHLPDTLRSPVSRAYRALDRRRQACRRPVAGEQEAFECGFG